jgi:hypothetical protein
MNFVLTNVLYLDMLTAFVRRMLHGRCESL